MFDPREDTVPNRPVDLVSRCRCGRTFSPMQWVELQKVNDVLRRCPCGLDVKLEPPLSFAEIKAAHALKGKA